MVQTISGRLIFTYGSPKNKYQKLIRANFRLSLLGILMGIFLLPNLAYLSTITPERLIELTNQERETNGLNSLTANQLLTKAAIAKGKAILESQTFKHNIDNKKFSSWIRDAGYNYSYVGENLAIDFVTSEAVVEAWENSPLHKKNLLSPYYQEIGISTVPGKFQEQDTTVVVQIFGAPAIGSAQPVFQNSGPSYLNSNLVSPEINLSNPQFNQMENLLTHSIINREALPFYNNKLVLPNYNYLSNQVNPVRELAGSALSNNYLQFKSIAFSNGVNKFIVQPEYYFALNNFIMIFASLTLIYLLIFLYYYYFFKINKLISI